MKRIFDWFSHGAWFDFGRETGIREERERIIKYLIDKEVLRESMFGNGWVALHHSEGHGIDLGRNLGA